jgi:hypothetical protein
MTKLIGVFLQLRCKRAQTRPWNSWETYTDNTDKYNLYRKTKKIQVVEDDREFKPTGRRVGERPTRYWKQDYEGSIDVF